MKRLVLFLFLITMVSGIYAYPHMEVLEQAHERIKLNRKFNYTHQTKILAIRMLILLSMKDNTKATILPGVHRLNHATHYIIKSEGYYIDPYYSMVSGEWPVYLEQPEQEE